MNANPTPDQHRDVREVIRLAPQLDNRAATFPFDHARLAWLESHGDSDA